LAEHIIHHLPDHAMRHLEELRILPTLNMVSVNIALMWLELILTIDGWSQQKPG